MISMPNLDASEADLIVQVKANCYSKYNAKKSQFR